MLISNTDRDWEKYGKCDPYFGVLSDDKYHNQNLTEQSKEEFFRSGYDHIAEVLKAVRKHIDPDFTIKRALDFGCGVGRLVIPLSEIAEQVVGVDVSLSMLDEARRNCESRSIRNVKLLRTNDDLAALEDDFDFIHSFIVFQHIPIKRGERIFSRLLSRLADRGVGAVHFTYAKRSNVHWLRKTIELVKRYIPLVRNVIHMIRGRGFCAPSMQMNSYNLNKLFFIMQAHNIHQVVAECTDHGSDLGVVFYFRKGYSA